MQLILSIIYFAYINISQKDVSTTFNTLMLPRSLSNDQLICSILNFYTGADPNATQCTTGGNGIAGKSYNKKNNINLLISF